MKKTKKDFLEELRKHGLLSLAKAALDPILKSTTGRDLDQTLTNAWREVCLKSKPSYIQVIPLESDCYLRIFVDENRYWEIYEIREDRYGKQEIIQGGKGRMGLDDIYH